MLFGLMVFLSAGLIAIVAASAREAELPAGMVPDLRQFRRGRNAALATAAVVLGALLYGHYWWTSDERAYRENIFKPLKIHAQVEG